MAVTRRRVVLKLWFLVFVIGLTARAQAQSPKTQNPKPILFADGITRRDELPLYAKLGLNTVVVRVPWRPTADGSLTIEDLPPVRAFADDAAARGLNVIYALPAAPQGMETQLRASADGQGYFTLWEAWAGSVMRALKDTPRLTGWMLPDDPRSLNYADDAGFARWLGRNYANAQVVNTQWDAAFVNLNIGLSDADELAQNWKRGGALPSEFSTDQLSSAMQRGKNPPSPQTRLWAFHPATLASAQFRVDAWRALVQGWATRVRSFDKDNSHLIFSGRLPDYAQMLALPPGVDVSLPDARPTVAERDFESGNPNAVTIARRGGHFRALPMLQSAPDKLLPAIELARVLPSWMEANLSRGATGLGFSSWESIARDVNLQSVLSKELLKLNATGFATLWDHAPIATFAIALSPLPDAYQLPIEGAPRGLYGFGAGLVAGEPADLMYALRWGTAYGSVDVISTDDLTNAQTPLSRYNTLLLPQALSLPDEAATALQRYAFNGGAIVADLGIGSLQTGGAAANLPSSLRALFGVTPTGVGIGGFNDNLRRLGSHPLLPTFSGVKARNDGRQLTGGDNPGGAAFSGPVGYFEPQEGTIPIAIAARIDTYNGTARALLTANPIGNGFALFAPWRLWSGWRSGARGFDSFHGDLFGRGATVVVSGVQSLVPQPPMSNTPSYPEILNYPDAVAAFNHAQQPARGIVFTSGVGHFLWSDGVALFGSASDAEVAEGRPAPIAGADDYQKQAHPITLYVRPNAHALQLLRVRPIRAQNLGGGALCAQINEETPKSLSLTLWPNTTSIGPMGDAWSVTLGDAGVVRVQLFDSLDGYRAPSGSRHRVVVSDMGAAVDKNGARPMRAFDVIADSSGMVGFEASGKQIAVKVAPLS